MSIADGSTRSGVGEPRDQPVPDGRAVGPAGRGAAASDATWPRRPARSGCRGDLLDERPDDLEPAREEARAAGVALDLAAGGLGEARRLEQHDGVDVQLVLLGDGLADRREDRLDRPRPGLALDLVDDDQPLLAVAPRPRTPRRRSAAARVAPLDGPLDVLGIDVAAADDDQVLEPAGDEQLAVAEEAEVAGAQERPARRCRPGVPRNVCSVSSGRSQ